VYDARSSRALVSAIIPGLLMFIDLLAAAGTGAAGAAEEP